MARIKFAFAARKCAFCSKPAGLMEGATRFAKDGTPTYYCSRKCLRNAALKRNPRERKWSAGGRA
ncbi:MAG: 50S ribosomal protein L24 [Candidatus Micrarchaeia archaeon]